MGENNSPLSSSIPQNEPVCLHPALCCSPENRILDSSLDIRKPGDKTKNDSGFSSWIGTEEINGKKVLVPCSPVAQLSRNYGTLNSSLDRQTPNQSFSFNEDLIDPIFITDLSMTPLTTLQSVHSYPSKKLSARPGSAPLQYLDCPIAESDENSNLSPPLRFDEFSNDGDDECDVVLNRRPAIHRFRHVRRASHDVNDPITDRLDENVSRPQSSCSRHNTESVHARYQRRTNTTLRLTINNQTNIQDDTPAYPRLDTSVPRFIPTREPILPTTIPDVIPHHLPPHQAQSSTTNFLYDRIHTLHTPRCSSVPLPDLMPSDGLTPDSHLNDAHRYHWRNPENLQNAGLHHISRHKRPSLIVRRLAHIADELEPHLMPNDHTFGGNGRTRSAVDSLWSLSSSLVSFLASPFGYMNQFVRRTSESAIRPYSQQRQRQGQQHVSFRRRAETFSGTQNVQSIRRPLPTDEQVACSFIQNLPMSRLTSTMRLSHNSTPRHWYPVDFELSLSRCMSPPTSGSTRNEVFTFDHDYD